MYIKTKDNEYEVRYGNGDKPKAKDEVICSFARLEVAVDFIRYLRGDNVENEYRIKGAMNAYQDKKRREKIKKKVEIVPAEQKS